MNTKLITLKDKTHIERVFAEGSSFVNRFFVVRAVSDQGNPTRFVITVSKKYGNAVQRNRIKRQVREILRHNMVIIPEGLSYAVIPRFPCHQGSFPELKTALLEAVLGAAKKVESKS